MVFGVKAKDGVQEGEGSLEPRRDLGMTLRVSQLQSFRSDYGVLLMRSSRWKEPLCLTSSGWVPAVAVCLTWDPVLGSVSEGL